MPKSHKHHHQHADQAPAAIDRVLNYLPMFERGDFAKADEHYGATGRYAPDLDRFRREIYDSGFGVQFDWMAWKQTEGDKAFDEAVIAQADLPAIRKLLTACVRQDRFSKGFFAVVCANGVVLHALQRLYELRTGRKSPPHVPAPAPPPAAPVPAGETSPAVPGEAPVETPVPPVAAITEPPLTTST